MCGLIRRRPVLKEMLEKHGFKQIRHRMGKTNPQPLNASQIISRTREIALTAVR